LIRQVEGNSEKKHQDDDFDTVHLINGNMIFSQVGMKLIKAEKLCNELVYLKACYFIDFH